MSATTEGLPVESGGTGGCASIAPEFVDEDAIRRMLALRRDGGERRHADADEADVAIRDLARGEGDETRRFGDPGSCGAREISAARRLQGRDAGGLEPGEIIGEGRKRRGLSASSQAERRSALRASLSHSA